MLFCFNRSAPPASSTLSLHDALPIFLFELLANLLHAFFCVLHRSVDVTLGGIDRKSTRLNSSHVAISYAVLCLKKKNAVPSLTMVSRGWRLTRAATSKRTSWIVAAGD